MDTPTLAPFRERLRTLLILCFFSEPYNNPNEPHLTRVFHSEVKIQKIDFLIRYPSYLCYELLRSYEEENSPTATEVKYIVRNIFRNNEPTINTDEMKRFFYGAYEELDDIIAFLKSVNLVDLKSQKNALLRDVKKVYFVTDYGVERVKNGLTQVPAAQWYIDRCKLIKTYFGDKSGSDLKRRQYDIEQYKETPLGSYIADIEDQVRAKFYTFFGEML
jgi:hypothetical protein